MCLTENFSTRDRLKKLRHMPSLTTRTFNHLDQAVATESAQSDIDYETAGTPRLRCAFVRYRHSLVGSLALIMACVPSFSSISCCLLHCDSMRFAFSVCLRKMTGNEVSRHRGGTCPLFLNAAFHLGRNDGEKSHDRGRHQPHRRSPRPSPAACIEE